MQRDIASSIKSTPEIADIALWESIMAGDEAAFAKFITKHSKPLFNYGYRLCDDRDLLKDCIQDIFVEIWNRRHKITGSDKLKWYLFKSLRNHIFREQAKKLRNEPLKDDYDFIIEFDVEYHLIINDEEQELALKVKKTLEYLPPRQKEVVYLRYFEGLTFDDIADIMDISKQSAHNLLQKSYKTFREKWDVCPHTLVPASTYLYFLSLIIK